MIALDDEGRERLADFFEEKARWLRAQTEPVTPIAELAYQLQSVGLTLLGESGISLEEAVGE